MIPKTQVITKFFLASLLLSSVFMFNGQKTLNKQDFNRLAFVTNLSDRVKLKKNTSQVFNKKTLKNECPDFIWLVRDFSLSLNTSKDDYIKRFLEFEDCPDEDDKQNKNEEKIKKIDKRNQIKENLIDSFKTIDCSLLRQPIFGEEQLQNMDNIELSKLRKEYLSDLNALADQVSSTLRPKEINGQKMNGVLFSEYLRLIVEMINSNKTIFLHETISLALNAMADMNFNECLNKFDNEVNYLAYSFPIKTFDLENKISKAKETSLNHLKSYFLLNHKTMFDEFEKKLKTKLEERSDKLKDENKSKIKSNDLSLALNYWRTKFDSKVEDKYKKVDEFERDIDSFKREFSSSKSFDSNYRVHLNEQFWNELLNQSNINVSSLKEKIVQKEHERNKEEMRKKEQELSNMRASLTSSSNPNSGYSHQPSYFSSSFTVPSYALSNPTPSMPSSRLAPSSNYTYDNPRSMYHGSELYKGPRGGTYYFDNGGRKRYI